MAGVKQATARASAALVEFLRLESAAGMLLIALLHAMLPRPASA